jgi:hypothetical protein
MKSCLVIRGVSVEPCHGNCQRSPSVLRDSVERAWRFLGANYAAPVNQGLPNVAILSSWRLAQVHLHVAARDKPQAMYVLREHADCKSGLKHFTANRHAKTFNPFARDRAACRV